jgi:dTDP-4-dehydrorhamnose reductase
MRYAVLGAHGQLGRDLCRLWGDAAMPLSHEEADLARPETLLAALGPHRPEVVVNCAAFNFVDRAEREPEAAFAVNALGVHHLARACAELSAVLVHFSTDYVFGRDVQRNRPYSETDAPGPTCVYGASKLAGEYLAQISPKHFVIRTCGLYGLAGRTSQKSNFIEMILRQISQDKPLRVVFDQRCTPTFSNDLARAIASLVATAPYGLYHLTNAGDCSWLEFAQAILDLRGERRPIQPVRTEEFGSPAGRPGYSVLDCTKAHHAGVAPLRPWKDALADYLSQRPNG